MIEQIEPALCEIIITSYEGEKNKQNGCYEGQGKATFDTGCSYEGGFKNGMMHGTGTFKWPDGVVYEGDFVNGKMHGKGKYTWSDGSTYEGGIANGKRNGGDGIFTCSAGQIYDGDWVDGKRQGKGQMWYTNNYEQVTHFTGDWVNGMRDGFGVMTYPSGNKYEGQWKADKKCGRGVMTWNATNEVYVGDWKDDKPHGRGEHIWGFDGGSRGGMGQAKAGRQICNIYRGEWYCGVRCGFGTFFYSNGSQYSGNWKDNMKHGDGVFIFPDGRIYVGDFEKDRMIAEGAAQPNPRATDDVSPQTRLNVADAIAKCPWNKATSGNVPAPTTRMTDDALRSSRSTRSKTSRANSPNRTTRPSTANSADSADDASSIASIIDIPSRLNFDNFTNDLERLLLRYHQYTKALYLRYADLAAVDRLSKTDLDLSKTDPYITEWPEVEKIIFKARNIYSRMFCMDLARMYRFCHELGIIGPTFHMYNVTRCFREMKISQRHVAKAALQDHRARKVNQSYDPYNPENAAKLPVPPSTLAFPRNPHENSLEFLLEIDYLPGTPMTISPASLCQISDSNRMLPSILEQRRVMSKLEIDPRQPILFREFVELLVRVLMEKGYRDYLRAQARAATYAKMNRIKKEELKAKEPPKEEDDDPYKEEESLPEEVDPGDEEVKKIDKARKKVTPFDVVFQQLAQKLYPLSNDREVVAPFFAMFYHGRVQDCIQRNEDALRKLWGKLVEKAKADNVLETKQGGSVAELRHFLNFIDYFKGSAFNPTADAITVLFILERIAAAFSDINSEAPNLAASQTLPPPPTNRPAAIGDGGFGEQSKPPSRVTTTVNTSRDANLITALLDDDGEIDETKLGQLTTAVAATSGTEATTATEADAEDARDDGGINPLFYKIPFSEFACVGMKINYVDFTEMLCRVIMSDLWVFKPPLPVETEDTESLAGDLDALSLSAVEAAAAAVEESKSAHVPALDLHHPGGGNGAKATKNAPKDAKSGAHSTTTSKPGSSHEHAAAANTKKDSIAATPQTKRSAANTPAGGKRASVSNTSRRASKEKALGSKPGSPAITSRKSAAHDEAKDAAAPPASAESKEPVRKKEVVDPELKMSQDEKLTYRLDKWLAQLDLDKVSLLQVAAAPISGAR